MANLDSPGIAAWRPAALQVSSVLLGLLLHARWPFESSLVADVSWVAGPLFVGLGVTIIALSYGEFFRAKTTLRPDRGANALVRTGPFAFSRNPLYVAVMIMITGIGVWVNSLWILGMLVPLFFGMSFAVIAPEERYLESRFGQEYLDYKSRVRRWL
ncbi:MAG: isoprenylcysteine carboxylmethyltransferase family protein [Myxococcota bacterium]